MLQTSTNHLSIDRIIELLYKDKDAEPRDAYHVTTIEQPNKSSFDQILINLSIYPWAKWNSETYEISKTINVCITMFLSPETRRYTFDIDNLTKNQTLRELKHTLTHVENQLKQLTSEDINSSNFDDITEILAAKLNIPTTAIELDSN